MNGKTSLAFTAAGFLVAAALASAGVFIAFVAGILPHALRDGGDAIGFVVATVLSTVVIALGTWLIARRRLDEGVSQVAVTALGVLIPTLAVLSIVGAISL